MKKYLMFQIHSAGGYGPIHEDYISLFSNGELRFMGRYSLCEVRASYQLPKEAIESCKSLIASHPEFLKLSNYCDGLSDIDMPIYDYHLSDGKYENHIPHHNHRYDQFDKEVSTRMIEESAKFDNFVEEFKDIINKYVDVEKIWRKMLDLIFYIK